MCTYSPRVLQSLAETTSPPALPNKDEAGWFLGAEHLVSSEQEGASQFASCMNQHQSRRSSAFSRTGCNSTRAFTDERSKFKSGHVRAQYSCKLWYVKTTHIYKKQFLYRHP